MKKIRISGTGSAVPKRVVKNEDLTAFLDTNDEWIRERTGILQRHVAIDETACSLASEAAQKALQDAGKSAEDVDLLLVATISADYATPSLACQVQKEIGANRAVAFDVNGACSGFLFALHTAVAYLESGMYQNALIIGVEILSKIINWQDRGSCILFGDGAGAAVVEKSADTETGCILSMVQGTLPQKWDVLSCKSREIVNPFRTEALCAENEEEKSCTDTESYVTMDGRQVYQFAVNQVPISIQEALAKAGVTTADISHFVLHQANLRIIQSVAKRLKEPIEKFPVNMQYYGNMSSASVPVLLDELHRGNRLVRGERMVLAGFGAGLSYGATVLEW